MLAIVDDHAVAIREAELLGHLAAHQHEMSQQIGISILGQRELGNWLARNHEEVGWCLGRHIVEGNAL